MTFRFVPSYSGMRQILQSEEMQGALREVAEKAMEFAISISPEKTGEYKSSFEVTVTAEGGDNPPGARAEAQLVNTSDHAVNVEWQDNYHVLGRTLDHLGE
jgi:hypothetical protein